MAKHKLTHVAVQNLKPKVVRDGKHKGEKADHFKADGNGLYVRARVHGTKDWLFIYTFGGKRRRESLGAFPAVPLDVAREEAERRRGLVMRGIDPQRHAEEQAEAQRAAKAKADARLTVRNVFVRWLAAEGVKRRDGGKEAQRNFATDVFPVIGDMLAEAVRKADVMAVIDPILARGSNRMAKNTLAELRLVFRWAMDRELVPADPTATIKKKSIGGADVERDRVLTAAELKALHAKLPEADMPETSAAALWVLLATCVRVGELTRARKADVDLDAGTWRIPKENAKNGREHVVHLSDFARRHIEVLLDLSPSKVWLFPNPSDAGPVSGKVLQKQFYDRQRVVRMRGRSKKVGALSLPNGRWTAHDLRRTGATMMGDLKVRPDVIDRCLNHVEASKVTRIYQRQELLGERREAFALLGDRLELLLAGGDKVVAGKFGRVA